MSHQKYSVPAIQARTKAPPPALITNNRISVPLQGRLYPFITPQTDLPEVFREMPVKLFERLEFSALRDKSTAFKKYAAAVTMMGQWRQEFDALAEAIANAGGFQTPHKMLEFQSAPAATAELAALPLDQIITVMGTVLKQAASRFLVELAYVFDEMVKARHLGLIDWTCKDACRYHYFEFKDETTVTGTRSQSSETVTGRLHTVTNNTQRDKERVVSLTRHVHDLIDATRLTVPASKPDLTDWRNNKLNKFPHRVRLVAERLPSWLPSEYVEGQQIRDLRIEREISRQQWTESETTIHTWEERPPVILETPQYRFDPAIIVGHYVLVGWNGDEDQRGLGNSNATPLSAAHYCKKCKGFGCGYCNGTGFMR